MTIDVLKNVEWLKKNEDALKSAFPETWTHAENFEQEDLLKLAFKLKLLGCNWTDYKQIPKIITHFEKIGFILRDGLTVKRNPHKVFK